MNAKTKTKPRKAAKPRRARKPKLTGADGVKEYRPKLAMRSIRGHVIETASQTLAWYKLPPLPWAFRGDAKRENLILTAAGQYAELQDRWVHVRVTSRPWEVVDWARAHVRAAGVERLDDVPGALSWDDYIIGEQRQLLSGQMRSKDVFLGVEVRRRGTLDDIVDRVEPMLAKIWPSFVQEEEESLADEVDKIDEAVADEDGLAARPVTAAEMRFLLTRSVELGLPAPDDEAAVGTGDWDTEDLAAIEHGASAWLDDPYAPTSTVRGRRGDNADVERHVAVLSVGLMQELNIPGADDPWMGTTDRLPFEVEWSTRFFVRKPEQVTGELGRQKGKVTSQFNHYANEHDEAPPQALARQHARASDIDDELSSGLEAGHTRVKGFARLAVSGATRKEALQRAQKVVAVYKPKVAIEHPIGQLALAREFIPGEPLAATVHQRRARVTWAAAAVPNVTSTVGDRRGVLLGGTSSMTQRPVAWDPWLAQEVRDDSGLTAILGGLGSGKSYLAAGIVYKTLRSGAYWTVLDPSGPLAKLCELPDLAPFSQAINLLNATPGTLNPYRVVPEPRIEHFANEPDPEAAFDRALRSAQAERRRLAQDTLMGVLPQSIAALPDTHMVVANAVRAVGGNPDRHVGMVIDQLSEEDEENRQHARNIQGQLRDLMDRLSLLIPEPGADPYANRQDQHRLTVLTMPGLNLPKEGVERADWTEEEALNVQLLNLAAWLTQRRVYQGDPEFSRRTGKPWQAGARKGAWIDEAFFLSEVASGRALMNRFSRDSRKWNLRVLLSSQIPSDFLRIKGFTSLVDSVFIGRLDDYEDQADALRMLKVPTGIGYESIIGRLGGRRRQMIDKTDTQIEQPRQFLFSDGTGSVEQMRVDFGGDHLEPLRRALDTRPNSTARPALRAIGDDDRNVGGVA